MKFWFIVLLLGSALGFGSEEGLPRGYVISQHNQEAVLKYLRPALLSHGGAGRIYYFVRLRTVSASISASGGATAVKRDHRSGRSFARF
jgi:hypothetical protein